MLWKLGKGVYIKEVDANLFLFQFYREIDIKRVIDGSSWSFNRRALIISRMKDDENHPVNFTIDLSKLLKGRMKIRKSGDAWIWITFKYENVPTFCFIYKLLGHSEKYCGSLTL